MKPLIKTRELAEEDKDRICKLYQSKKAKLTLDGKKGVAISKLGSPFPIVFIVNGPEIEFSSKTIERILNDSCNFKS